MNDTTALANGPVLDQDENSPLHAAWISNNYRGFKLLLEHLENSDSNLQNFCIKRANQIYPEFDTSWQILLKDRKYAIIKQKYDKFMKILNANVNCFV